MYRQIFTPNEQNNSIPFVIPREWYGQPVEIIVFPVLDANEQSQQDFIVKERIKKREELNKILDKYLVDLSGFKFNRDEANEYD